MKDIRIDSIEGNFKYRVGGLLYINGKILTVKIKNNDFYFLPGGHVELMESSEEAVLREMKEETGYDLKIKNLFSIVEDFFETKKGKLVHEVSFNYILEPKDIKQSNLSNYEIIENDKGELKKLEFRWMSPKDFEIYKFKPEILIPYLVNQNYDFIHKTIINKIKQE